MILSRIIARRRIAAGTQPSFVAAWWPVAADIAIISLVLATVLASKPSFAPHHWKESRLPPFKQAFRSSLAYRLCLVAQGRFDAMLTLRPSWEWDIAAGALIVAEASGRVTDPSGTALRFNNPHPQVPGVIAAGEELHASLAARLEPAAPTL